MIKCDKCNEWMFDNTKFCPNCEADKNITECGRCKYWMPNMPEYPRAWGRCNELAQHIGVLIEDKLVTHFDTQTHAGFFCKGFDRLREVKEPTKCKECKKTSFVYIHGKCIVCADPDET